jgi:hypothetical protein
MRSAVHTILRDADWLDASRAKAWRNLLLAFIGLGLAAFLVLSRGGLDAAGKALGTDFVSFYAASQLTLAGHPAAAYQPAAHRAAEFALFGRDLGYAAFFYPPMFLLLCAPLALLPYLGALAAWLAATGAAFVWSLRGWIDRRLGWATVAAFPAVLSNAIHGQNAFLSAALLGTGALWLQRRPVLAGVAFGLLAFKPHLGLLLPLALLAGGRWKTAVAAAVTVVAFAGASVLAFGWDTWQAFLANSGLARATMEQGLVDPAKMVSAFAAVRILSGSVGLAYAIQGLVSIAIAVALVRAIRLRPGVRAEGAMIVLAALIASPFLLDYDLVIAAVPLAWLAGEGLAHGFRPWEKAALFAAFLLPFVARVLALQVHLPIAPLVLGALFVLMLRRITAPDAAVAAAEPGLAQAAA